MNKETAAVTLKSFLGVCFIYVVYTLVSGTTLPLTLEDIAGILFSTSAITWYLRSKINPEGAFTAIAIAVFSVIGIGVYGWSVVNPEPHRNALTISKKDSGIPEIEAKNAGLVPYSVARQVAEAALLKEHPELTSQFQILNRPTRQLVKNRLVWVFSLAPTSLIRSLTDPGVPGFVMVDANNSEVTVKMVPQTVFITGWFSHNIERIAQIQNFFTRYAQPAFEVSDDYIPYWVIPTFKYKVGLNLAITDGALLINAVDGSSKHYALDEVPSWVDRMISLNEAEFRSVSKLSVVGDLWNRLVTKQGVQTITSTDLVYFDGRAQWVIGTQSTASDKVLTGFLVIDASDGSSQFFSEVGIQEQRAKSIAESKVKAQQWLAGNAIPYRVEGQLVYVMPMLVNDAIQGFAVVEFGQSTEPAVGIGPTLDKALQSFSQQPRGVRAGTMQQEASTKTITGTALRVGMEVRNGNSIYHLKLQGENPVFIGTSETSPMMPLIQAGDLITVTYRSSGGPVVSIISIQPAIKPAS